MYRIHKRPLLLLEVLIALALVALCAIPLIAPHLALIHQQKKLVNIVETDRLVNLMYVHVLEQMHKNKIPWQAIQNHEPLSIEPVLEQIFALEENSRVALKGEYQFTEIRHKENKKNGWQVYWLTMTFAVQTPDQNKPLLFPYDVTIMRHVAPSTLESEATPEEQPNAVNPQPQEQRTQR